MKDTKYYDKESVQYSQKRYPETEMHYVHFFFKRRLALLLGLLARITNGKRGMSLLEVGCADGFVLSTIAKKLSCFDTLVGIDISPQMIETAKALNSDPRTHYYVRGERDFEKGSLDIIAEVGVLNLTDLREDLLFAKDHLKEGGYYICSLASSTSLTAKLKPSNRKDYKHFMSFTEYERTLREFFVIEARIPYGLFVPHIWKIPALARFIQPAVGQVFTKLLPNAFHEKIYLLRKR